MKYREHEFIVDLPPGWHLIGSHLTAWSEGRQPMTKPPGSVRVRMSVQLPEVPAVGVDVEISTGSRIIES